MVGAEGDLIGTLLPSHETDADQVLEFALNLTGSRAGPGDNLAKIKRAVGMREQHTENVAPGLAEQDTSEVLVSLYVQCTGVFVPNSGTVIPVMGTDANRDQQRGQGLRVLAA